MTKLELEEKVKALEAQNAELENKEQVKFNSLRDFVLSATSKIEEFAPKGSGSHIFAARVIKGIGVVTACYLPQNNKGQPVAQVDANGNPLPAEAVVVEDDQILNDIVDTHDKIMNPGQSNTQSADVIGDLDDSNK